MLTRGRTGEDSERGETKFSAGVTVTAPTTMHVEERQRECSQRHSEHAEGRAGRLSGHFRLRAYRTVQARPVLSRSVHHGIFPDVYFYTQSLQRPHERRPMASRREQVSALFFVAWTPHRLTECFPWTREGPNPLKETLTFKKRIFWQTTSGSLPAGLKQGWRNSFGVMTTREEIASIPSGRFLLQESKGGWGRGIFTKTANWPFRVNVEDALNRRMRMSYATKWHMSCQRNAAACSLRQCHRKFCS